jgi:hypothetical protein
MVCGEFGSPSLAPHGKSIGFLNAVLCLLGVCFGIVGCVSYTNNFDALANAPWAKAMMKFSGTDLEIFEVAGIRSYAYYTVSDDDKKVPHMGWPAAQSLDTSGNGVITYEFCVDTIDAMSAAGSSDADVAAEKLSRGYERCDKCNTASVGVVTMCSFALIAAAACFLMQIMRVTCDSTFAKDVSILAGGAAFVFGVIAYSVFLPCAMATKDHTEDADEQDVGIGAKLVLGSFIMALIVTIITLITPVAKEEEAVATDDITKV